MKHLSAIQRESVCCATCGSNQTRTLYTIPLPTRLLSGLWVDGKYVAVDEAMTVVQCHRCGLQYVNPRWLLGPNMAVYPAELEQEYFANTYVARQQTYTQFIAQLPRWLGYSPRSLLDVGCGDGVLLDAAYGAGFTCTGIEVSATLREALTEKYQDKITIVDSIQSVPQGDFDVITLLNVIEHVHAPMELVDELAHKLKPTGLLFIHTPNAGGLPAKVYGARWSQLEPLEHLYYFSAQTLGTLLEKSGLEPVGRFHLAVSGRLKGAIQVLLGRLGLYLDNGLGIVARRKVASQ